MPRGRIPETVDCQTKCEHTRQMIKRLWKALISFARVVVGMVYGGNEDLRVWLEVYSYSLLLLHSKTIENRIWSFERS
jgi:hypothetical protein